MLPQDDEGEPTQVLDPGRRFTEEAPPGWRIGAGVGVGHAYGRLGVQVQARRGQFAGFLAAGHPSVTVLSGGLRWYPSGDRGPVFSLHASHTLELESIEPLSVLAFTLGWRFWWKPGRWEQEGHGIYAELGAGLALFRYEGENGVSHGFGALGPGGGEFPMPDVALAVGFEW